MRAVLLLSLLGAVAATVIVTDNAISKDDLERLQGDLDARFDSFTRPDSPDDGHPLIATTVRLAFHDCAESYPSAGGAGICDGCIDADNEENAGLEYGAVYPLEQVFRNVLSVNTRGGGSYTHTGGWNGNPSGTMWSSALSRADFWQLAALLAIERANSIAYVQGGCCGTVGPTSSEIVQMQPIARAFGDVANLKYYVGRADCQEGGPFSTSAGLTTNPFWNFADLHNFFSTAFPGFTKQDTVAIMGAHTLGRAHGPKPAANMEPATSCCGGSGFDGAWKFATNTWTHEYFVDSYFITWEQVRANQHWDGTPAAGIDASRTKRQYKHEPNEVGSKHQGLMLNTDMVLYFDTLTEDITTGEEMCSVYDLMCLKEDPNSVPPPCAAPNDFLQPHQEGDLYHQFDAMWKTDFWVAWEKLTTNGYNMGQLAYHEKPRPSWTELVSVMGSYEVWGLSEADCDLRRLYRSTDGGSFTMSGRQAYVLVFVESAASDANGKDVTFDVTAWLGSESPPEQQNTVEQFARYVQQYASVVYLDPHGSHCRGKCRAEPTPEEKAQWVGLYEISRTEVGQGEEDETFQGRFSGIIIDSDGASISPSSCPPPACPAPIECNAGSEPVECPGEDDGTTRSSALILYAVAMIALALLL